MWGFRLGYGVRLLLQTWPFILLRFVVLLASTTIAMAVVSACAWTGFAIGSASGEDAAYTGGAIGAFAGFLFFAITIYLLREYIFYLLKAAHIAVIAELLHGTAIPPSRQIGFGLNLVCDHLLAGTTLFAIDQLIESLINGFSDLVNRGLGGVGGGSGAGYFLQSFLGTLFGLTDEIALAYIMRRREKPPLEAAREGMACYARNLQIMTGNALSLTIITIALSALFYAAALTGAAAILYSRTFTAATAAIAIYLPAAAWAMTRAFVKPLALTCLMQVFFAAANGTPPPYRRRIDGGRG